MIRKLSLVGLSGVLAAAAVAVIIAPRLTRRDDEIARSAATPAAPPGRVVAPRSPPISPDPPSLACSVALGYDKPASANAASLSTAAWSVAGRPEVGWEVYAPLTSHELATACSVGQPGFAAALASWQAAHALAATGVMDEPTLKAMNVLWLRRRPFVQVTSRGDCPPPPPDTDLAAAQPEEGYLRKPIRLHARALSAYRRMVAQAREVVPEVRANPELLTIFSGFRPPQEEAARCAQGSACGTPAKARCSAHRTGLAMDLFLGAAPGSAPESSDDANRAFQARSPAYRWLVAHGEGFGLRPYPFEPWHWEFADSR